MIFVSNANYEKPVESGTVFRTTVNGITVSIHRIIHLDGWFLSCHSLGIDDRPLDAETLSGAIEESKGILTEVVQKVNDFLKCYTSEDWEISRY